jgi:putative membrane protein insertion efficiency factor
MRSFLFALLRWYRLWNYYHGRPSCRFHPTCSEYAEHALQRFDVLSALFLIVRRLLRCHPFAKSGIDPVPLSFSLFSFLKGSSR